MVFQILLNYNMRKELFNVADSLERFENTCIWDLRWRIASEVFGECYQSWRDLNSFKYRFYIKLIFGNDLLEDRRTLGFYNITPLSVVTVVLRMPGGGVYQVLMNYNDKTPELLDVADSFEGFNNTTIIKLKWKFTSSVPAAAGIDLKHLRVIFGSDLLEDGRTLGSYKLTHLSALMVVMRMPGGGDKKVHQVLINYNGKKNELDVADSLEEFENTTVLELKLKFISSYPGAPECPEDFRVIFGLNQLEDHRTLGFYKVIPLSVLLCVLSMPGGGGGLIPPREVIPRTASMDRLSYSM